MSDFWQPQEQQWEAIRPRLGGDNDMSMLRGKTWYLLGTFSGYDAAVEALTAYHRARGVELTKWNDRQYADRSNSGTQGVAIGLINPVAERIETIPFPMGDCNG